MRIVDVQKDFMIMDQPPVKFVMINVKIVKLVKITVFHVKLQDKATLQNAHV